MSDQKSIITQFYTAFQNKDADAMAALYHEDAAFEDPAFGKLNSEEVKAMWRMLIERGGKDLKIEFKLTTENDRVAQGTWQAFYTFSQTQRQVHNIISVKMKFKDGKITEHYDEFDFWRWSGMALGLPGKLLGWSPLIKNKVRAKSRAALDSFMAKRND
ncbi:MAG: nuclear transport factor 2 family protein [Cyclobacteriaceae bacterium]